MLLIEVLILAVLLIIFVQDMMSRSVYWILFPLLATLFIVLRLLSRQNFADIGQSTLINLSFLVVQLLLVSAYFSLKRGQWVNITAGLLGWGDVFFLLCAAVYLSVLNFLFFYIFSLMITLLLWLTRQLMINKKSKQIPLAGLQALFLAACLAGSWWFLPVNLTYDSWVFHFLFK